jgi:hypothetical protein
MRIMRPPGCRRLALLWLAAWTSATIAFAGDFRVKTEVYVGDQKEPVAESLTLFSGSVVYDFLLTGPEEITVLDTKRGRFLVLDPARRVRTTVTTDQLRRFAAAIKTYGGRSSLDFFLNPKFEVGLDGQEGWLTLSGEQMTYRVKGIEPKYPDAARRYQQFADWCARFNATQPGNLPPFARIQLNQALAEKGLMPSEVERTIDLADGLVGRKQKVRSRHSAVWVLSKKDRDELARADRYLADFRTVSLQDYWRKATVGSRGGSSRR